MQVVSFIWKAKYGHFLRAEANKNALTYPVPPRTAVIGLLGAILGMTKDSPQKELATLQVAIAGSPVQRFWHRIKLRKDPPVALPYTVTAKIKGSEQPRPEMATLLNQEWLWKPSFWIYVALPSQPALFAELVERLQKQQWHFSPCMGLSELLADLQYQNLAEAEKLAAAEYQVDSICPQSLGLLKGQTDIAVHLLRMPISVDEQRVFKQESIYLERHGKPIRVYTQHAWQVESKKLIFF